ncbi:hypothetical protein GS16_00460 [Candidatus Liberibacter solanacearum]|uniref:Uncharacterized protein n=1 Tax=Candidatus Liberibacter solanacearum TaxID=556287 RepID=A0A094Z4S1_9HYPH|nr:hypothetical protein [Candidatus Liberibacter solanacearum]KGB27515.1 hypothetical protein GS16_03655 [Candidatus Liberibacter solanacearum]KGB27964.1 hypothetical protein GS16_00460 [Candidatus Liberibacter solanacearum]KJZ81608.1 hypothetical protein DJ66_0330 [Candidatus Liberibacter solanacearum]
MGKVSQHYMEEIDENYEFNCLHNPRFNLDPEPEPSIKEEVETTISSLDEYLLWCCEIVEALKSSDYNILDKIDEMEGMRLYVSKLLPMVNHLETLLKKSWEEPEEEEEEPDEEPKEHPDQEHADAYYADQI